MRVRYHVLRPGRLTVGHRLRGMAAAGVGGGRVEQGAVGGAGGDGVGEGVVDLEDEALGAVVAVTGLVVAANNGESVHDVVGVVAGDAVEVEEGGVQLAAELEAALGVPAEGRAVVAAVSGEGGEVPGGVGELEDAGEEPGLQGGVGRPGGGGRVARRGQDRELVQIAVGEVSSTDLLARGVV
jgi:hypothetical protein